MGSEKKTADGPVSPIPRGRGPVFKKAGGYASSPQGSQRSLLRKEVVSDWAFEQKHQRAVSDSFPQCKVNSWAAFPFFFS